MDELYLEALRYRLATPVRRTGPWVFERPGVVVVVPPGCDHDLVLRVLAWIPHARRRRAANDPGGPPARYRTPTLREQAYEALGLRIDA